MDSSRSARPAEGLLAEYSALRSEVLRAQGQRMQVLSLTVGAMGVIMSVATNAVLDSQGVKPETGVWIAVGSGVALYAILIPSLIMMIGTQKHVQNLGSYLRLLIEPEVPGLNWETAWHEFKLHHQFKGGPHSMRITYFFLSVLPLLLPLYATSQDVQGWPALLFLAPLAIWALCLCCDLWFGISKGWKQKWWGEYAESRKEQVKKSEKG